MAGNCNYRNPLVRTGVSQAERLLQALLPSSAKPDERGKADLLLFAKEYARYLNYYSDAIDGGSNEPSIADDDWVAFMKMDVSVSLAALANIDTKGCFDYFDFIIDTIAATDKADEAALKKLYKGLYEFLYSLVYLADREWQHLPDDFDFTEYCGNMIQSSLNEQFYRVQEYHKQSDAAGLIDKALPLYTPDNAPVTISSIEYLTISPLSEIWAYTPAAPVTLPLQGATAAEQIKYIAQHAIFKGNIETLLKNITGLSQKAKLALDATFISFPKHSPHYALYLAFIQLFKAAQDSLNLYTGRHLDFYYKDVLHLKNNAAEPDSVHLVMELAKQTESSLVAAGTVFKAGKDADGLEMYYAGDADVVLNKGQVKTISSIFTKRTSKSSKQYVQIFAAPVANSGDGKGGAITATDGSWEPFGDPTINDAARTGFSVAHSILFMKEGTRKLTLTFECDDVSKLPAVKKINQWFTVRVTGEKGWIDAELKTTNIIALENKLQLKIEIGDDKDAVVPYSEALHAAGYITALPVMEFIVNTAAVHHNPHAYLELLQTKKITIDVDVTGLKDLSIQNEISVLDASKPFEMFGNEPHIGSSFIIGSKEVFLKNSGAAVNATLNIEWDKLSSFEASPDASSVVSDSINKEVRIKYLLNGVWKNIAGSQTIFNHVYPNTHEVIDGIEYHVHANESISLNLPLFTNSYDFTANSSYTMGSKSGFMAIDFIGPSDFGHGDYIKRFTEGTLAASPSVPSEPYTPTVKSLTIDYTASAEMNLYDTAKTTVSDSDGHFYHLYPFGHAEEHVAFSGAGSFISMLPLFSNEGEMFIGIESFSANQTIQILFQLSEGSANPLKEQQTILWYYLAANNQWKLFDDKSIADASGDLTVSGIIKFGFPDDASSATTLFTGQLFWIRGVLQKDTDAACNIIQLYAQAIKATFTDYLSKGNYYKNVLPAQTISKLLISDSNIKKIQQPYSSFNGRVKESDDDFRIRVSERLRHKNRGIAVWDYEHIVLQNFPEIYKVKCINHTRVTLNGNTETHNEMAPGYVLVVPIPDLHDKNAVDPLQPATSIGTLSAIETLLKKIISPHVRLQVKNAKYEEIQLDFRVKFNSDDTAYYHDVLVQEIEAYLSPWAYDVDAPINFGGRVYKSVLLNFVEERSYVDYVTCFKMYHYVNGLRSGDIDEAVATSARTILVSKSGATLSDKHKIDYVNVDCDC